MCTSVAHTKIRRLFLVCSCLLACDEREIHLFSNISNYAVLGPPLGVEVPQME